MLVTCTSGTGAGANNPALRSNTLFNVDGVCASFDWRLLPGPFTGAGSTMSAAIAALMARGAQPSDAARRAQDYTAKALAHAQRFGMGRLTPNKFFAHTFHESNLP